MKIKVLLVLLLFSGLAFAQFPRPVGYVNDFANVLPDKQMIENELSLYEKNTTVEIAVVTLDAVPEGYTLFDYGVALFDDWNIGQKGEDNGILILIVENGTVGNRMRIELGYGIQGYITGAEAGQMLDRSLPFYENGDYQSAVASILVDISDQLVDYVPGQVRQNDWLDPSANDILFNIILPNFPLFIFLIIIIASAALSNRCPYCVRGKLKCDGDHCVCQRCGRRVTRKKRYAPIIIGGFGGGGGGGGGFGGGGSGGGGAGR